MSARVENLATAAIQHGETPYHFRAFVVNETTVISLFHNAEIAELSGFGAGFLAGLRRGVWTNAIKLKDFPHIGARCVSQAASQRADFEIRRQCKGL